MTIEEAKSAKSTAEYQIYSLLNKFENETGLRIKEITMKRTLLNMCTEPIVTDVYLTTELP